MSTFAQNPGALSVTLIGPDEQRRKSVAAGLAECQVSSVREFTSYPSGLEDLPEMLAKNNDVILIDLDSDPDYALEVVESICSCGAPTVMVYSAESDRDFVISAMRAGAREFLTLPINLSELTDALARASVRHPEAPRARLSSRRLFVFLGVKGGVGTTTLAANFAAAVAQDSGQKTLLIDLGEPLGDCAINLGIAPEYSSANAFQDISRLDAAFLASLLTVHSSGLSILTAPTEFTTIQPSVEAIDKLLAVARTSFRNVIVDLGARLDLRTSSLFEDVANIYLITQIGISELRNANRLIKHFFAERSTRLQIVINRFTPHALTFDDEHIAKALTRPANWRVPDDYAAARRTQNTATALILEDSPIARAIRLMARDACGLPANPAKKKFSFFS